MKEEEEAKEKETTVPDARHGSRTRERKKVRRGVGTEWKVRGSGTELMGSGARGGELGLLCIRWVLQWRAPGSKYIS